jgi:uncharacterized membrane protein
MMATLMPGIGHLQNIHPLLVHFPIGLLLGSALFYILAWIFKRDIFVQTAFATLVLGAISAAFALGTGLYAEDGVMISRSVREHLLIRHKELMLVAFSLSWILALWAAFARHFPRKGRTIFLMIFLGLVCILALGADYGSRMVYDYNAGGDACGQPIDFVK